MTRLLREPLVHFLLLGAGLFLVNGLMNRTASVDSDQRIVVSAGRIEQLTTVFQKVWQRPPTAKELKGIVDDFVLEEVYYRQAVAMGMDRDDTIIRRRMRQKLEFLTDDAASLIEPTEEELADYLAEHEEDFRASATYTFRQIYFNPEKHGDDPQGWVKGQLEVLRSGGQLAGDPTLLPESFQQATRRSIDGTFGSEFSRQLDKLTTGQWQGPILSGLGLHLVRVDQRTSGRLPELEEIRPIVEREWSNERRLVNREKMNDELLKQYEIVVEWPDENVATKNSSEARGG